MTTSIETDEMEIKRRRPKRRKTDSIGDKIRNARNRALGRILDVESMDRMSLAEKYSDVTLVSWRGKKGLCVFFRSENNPTVMIKVSC